MTSVGRFKTTPSAPSSVCSSIEDHTFRKDRRHQARGRNQQVSFQRRHRGAAIAWKASERGAVCVLAFDTAFADCSGANGGRKQVKGVSVAVCIMRSDTFDGVRGLSAPGMMTLSPCAGTPERLACLDVWL